jgi:hypothetical protein
MVVVCGRHGHGLRRLIILINAGFPWPDRQALMPARAFDRSAALAKPRQGLNA